MVLARRPMGGGDMDNDLHKNAKFWAVTVAIWFCLILAIENIIQKVNLLIQLSN